MIKILSILSAIFLLSGCANMTTAQQRTVSGAAIGGAIAGIVGSGIGAGVGYVTHLMVDNEEKK